MVTSIAGTHPDYRHLLEERGYLWKRPPDADSKHPDPSHPHVKLPGSGLHSTGYCQPPIDDPDLMQTMAYELYDKLLMADIGLGSTDAGVSLVVGHERETASLATLLALCIHEHNRGKRGVRIALTKYAGTHQSWAEGYPPLRAGDRILVVENAVTTGVTAHNTIGAIQRYARKVGLENEIRILPAIGCVLDRTSRRGDGIWFELQKFQLVSYLRETFREWKATECPLCHIGSLALDPKKDWAELTRTT